jgi:hypothetical protein
MFMRRQDFKSNLSRQSHTWSHLWRCSQCFDENSLWIVYYSYQITHRKCNGLLVEVAIHCGMFFSYYLVYDLLEHFNKLATHRDLFDWIQSKNNISSMVAASFLRTEGYRFESRWRLFPFYFFHLFIFMCNIFQVFFNINPFLFFNCFFRIPK